MSVDKINSTAIGQHPHILSHAVKVPGLIFLSGQTPVGKDGKVVDGGIAEHTVSTFRRLLSRDHD